MRERGRCTGDTCGQWADKGRLGDELSGVVEKEIAMCRQRRTLASVEHDLAAVVRAMNQPEAAAADPRPVGLHHRQGGADRDGGIEGVASGVEDSQTGFGRQGMSRGNRSPIGTDNGPIAGGSDLRGYKQERRDPRAAAPRGAVSACGAPGEVSSRR